MIPFRFVYQLTVSRSVPNTTGSGQTGMVPDRYRGNRWVKPMDKDAPFGGKVMVFGGDFRQVLPVVPKSTRAETLDASLVRSYLWPLMENIQLLTNIRTRADTSFSEFLLCIGNGEENTNKENLIALPEQMFV
ncbi:hypothetical protein H5410_030339 [Solanum commersonii]|uniref:ATP-dependent DNA helicase n=1 Tax=Solanum commersonii TaxID=4109 RepID=A0A9J5YFD4_SOLCO|nr:hypothetical protein H5410_030339 [Solanum commersonii]